MLASCASLVPPRRIFDENTGFVQSVHRVFLFRFPAKKRPLLRGRAVLLLSEMGVEYLLFGGLGNTLLLLRFLGKERVKLSHLCAGGAGGVWRGAWRSGGATAGLCVTHTYF